MASRPLHRSVAIYLLMASLVVLTGCPNPNMHLWFYGETKMKKTYKTPLLDNRVQLEISSFSDLYFNCRRYGLSLTFTIRRGDSDLPLVINPNGVVVLVDDLRMGPSRDYPTLRLDTLSDRKFTLYRDFDLEVDIAALRRRGEIPVRIVLDSLLTLNGEPVHIDTVRALETQTCR